MSNGARTALRKDLHVDACLDPAVEGRAPSGLDAVRLPHEALPELDLADVDTSTVLFGRALRAPLLISSMTGGTERTGALNRLFAATAQQHGLGMGLGSGRVALEDPAAAASFRVRPVAPDVLLFANLGAVQLRKGYGPDDCRRLVELLEADALLLHLNPLQEAVQAGGDTEFGGLARAIASVVRALDGSAGRRIPVVAREVGCGLSERSAALLRDCGVAGLDASGQGGTSWAAAEGRATAQGLSRDVAETFAGWGYPVAESITNARAAAPHLPLIASGGIRSGLDIARALALGADVAASARPFLLAASSDAPAAALSDLVTRWVQELRVAMFCAGKRRVTDLVGLCARPVRLHELT